MVKKLVYCNCKGKILLIQYLMDEKSNQTKFIEGTHKVVEKPKKSQLQNGEI